MSNKSIKLGMGLFNQIKESPTIIDFKFNENILKDWIKQLNSDKTPRTTTQIASGKSLKQIYGDCFKDLDDNCSYMVTF